MVFFSIGIRGMSELENREQILSTIIAFITVAVRSLIMVIITTSLGQATGHGSGRVTVQRHAQHNPHSFTQGLHGISRCLQLARATFRRGWREFASPAGAAV
ncbi:hypothetical protein PgNI_05242 [Pyricularia grisea]|uniref:Uncharacterized protein n=1 Tax=Pyricularia grisea TaxID=148305 RepID=A0A6P8B7S4_PYRGI|nr:hypothetical protein PgNI_05242 [Pyricularia grisea]TLD11169.1 hypothetical protein PgNI_05242 [Pyricularia grisea]